MRAGIIIAKDDGNLRQHQLYDSRKAKLTVDPGVSPPHIGILDDFGGGTKFIIPASDTTTHVETLLMIKHNLTFKPMFLSYFYAKTAPTIYVGNKARYWINQALMSYNAFNGTEKIYSEADETNFYIKHSLVRAGGAPDPYTGFGSDYVFRIKYMITNQPSYLL